MNTPEWLISATNAPEVETSERCFIRELLNDTASPDASLAHTRVTSGVTTQLHSLDAVTEVYVILSGTGVMEVNGEKQSVSAGDQVVIPADMPQRIHNTGTSDLCFYCVCTPRFTPGCYLNLEA